MVADRGCAGALGLEADRRGDAGRRLRRIAVAPGAVIADRALFGFGALAHRLELFGRAIAAIGLAGGEQTLGDLGVMRGAGELKDDLAIPVEAEPSEAVDDRGRRLGG